MRLYIEGRRNGYSPEQCGRTMTVGELISYLEDYDEDTPVYINNDNHYTFGNIDRYSFEENDDDEDDDIESCDTIEGSVDVGSDALLDEAYNGSWFTVEGAGGDLQEWEDGLNEMLAEAGVGKPTKYVTFTGKQVSDHFGFEGSNRYPDDLTLLCFPLDGLDVGKLAMFKLRFGARWFDDIVDNSTGKYD